MIYIISARRGPVETFIGEHGIPPQECRQISSSRQMRGHHGVRYAMPPGWWMNITAAEEDEIRELLRLLEWKPFWEE